jgi:hypothetical protein
MNYRQLALAIVASLFVSLALADDVKTKDSGEANRSDAAGPNPSASNAQQPHGDDTVRVGLEYYSPEEQAFDTRHTAKQEEFSPKEEKAELAKIPAGGTCDVELTQTALKQSIQKDLRM